MRAFHGSVEEIRIPDILHSKNYLDFGRGFYLTVYQEQAEKWAKRKAVRTGRPPIVNEYEIPNQWGNLKVLNFNDTDTDWLEFVCSCRRGSEEYKDYDVIAGPVANDDVFKTVDMYFRGIWDKEKALGELRFFQMNNQINLVSQNAINKITFKRSYPLEI